MKKILLALTFAILPLAAQEAAKDLTPAEQLLKIMKFENTIIDGGEAGFPMVEQSLAGQDLTKEEMAEIKDAFMVYMGNLAADPELRAKTLESYNKAFTQDEILALIDFYKTPIGQKSLEVLPALTGDIMALSQKLAQKHVGSFQDAVTKILARKAAGEDPEGK